MNREVKAFGLLLATGILAGFSLSPGPARYMMPAPARPAQGDASEAEGGGREGGGRHGAGVVGDAEDRPQAHRAATAAEGGGAPARRRAFPAGDDAAEDAPEQPVPMHTASTGSDLHDLLPGNTLESRDARRDGLHLYLSRRGWKATGDATTLVVHRWAIAGDQLCTIGTGEALGCEPVTVARAAEAGVALGSVLGTLTTRGGTVWSILRGNVDDVPEVIPLVAGDRPLADTAHEGPPAATGVPALKALVNRPMLVAAEVPTGTLLDREGRWLTAHPLDAGATTGAGGVRVTIGAWATRAGALCLDEPGLELTRHCYQVQQWGRGSFRLAPVRTEGAKLDLAAASGGA